MTSTVLSYWGTDNRLFVLHITKDNTEIRSIQNITELNKAIEIVSLLIIKTSWNKEEKEKYIHNAHRVYETLIGQFNFELQPNLCIIPETNFAKLPFAALLSEKINPDLSMDKIPFLLKKHVIFYNYSVSLWDQLEKRKPTEIKFPICTFAPSFNHNNDYTPLYFNEEEAVLVAKSFGGKAFLGKEASKEKFLQNCRSCQIIHLSTHGRSFGSPDDNLVFQNEDGFDQFKLNELYNQTFNTDLLVLSACETGIGQSKKGEGVMSLARGFLYVGVKTVMSTLWQISDQGGLDLSKSLYSHLDNKVNKAKALQKAQIYLLEKTRFNYPYYWAAFIPIGSTDQIPMTNGGRPTFISLFALGLFSILYLLIFRKNL